MEINPSEEFKYMRLSFCAKCGFEKPLAFVIRVDFPGPVVSSHTKLDFCWKALGPSASLNCCAAPLKTTILLLLLQAGCV